MMKKILCVFLSLLSLLPALSSCSRAPEYGEIEGRLKELVEASAEINRIFFGEGLETYERVVDPRSSMEVYREADPSDPEKELLTYYYEVVDENYEKVIAFRASALPNVPFSYLEVRSSEDTSREPYYVDDDGRAWCYLLPDYAEKTYELYYDDQDPVDYDYVRADSKYLNVNEIKAAAELVYSKEYLTSIYDSMFVGTVGVIDSVNGLSARYIEYIDDEGGTYLMESNDESYVMIHEIRQYDFSTARIIKPSNAKYVTVSIDSYLPSNPSSVQNVRLSLSLQDGVWMLDSATY